MEFRKMARAEKSMPPETLGEIIKKAQYSVVTMIGDDGHPYGLPVNMAYVDGAFYFHGSAKGKKLDCLRENPNVCVTTAIDVTVDAQKYNTYYKSAICFGKATILEGEENYKAAEKYGEYYGMDPQVVKKMLARGGEKSVTLVKIEIEHISVRANGPAKTE